MGLFDRILGKKEPKTGRKTVSLEEVRRMCEQEINKSSMLDHEKIRQVSTEIRSTIDSIVKSLDELKSLKLDKAMDKRLYAVVKQSRNQLVMKTKKALGNVKFQKEHDYDSLLNFYKTLENSLKHIAMGNKKHSYYVSLVFRNEMIKIGKSINSLNSLVIDLGKYLSKLSQKNELYGKVLEAVKIKEGLEAEIKKLEKSREKLEQRKKYLESKIKHADEKPSKVSHEKYEDELKTLEKEKSKIERDMYSLLGVFSRPFRKYQKVGVFEKKVDLVLRDYLDQPLKTALSDDENVLGKILDGIEKLMEKNELGLKKSTKRKALSAIEHIRRGKLRNLVSKHKKVGMEIEKLEKKIKPLMDVERKQSAELKSDKESLKELDSKIKGLEKDLRDRRKRLEDSKKTLQRCVISLPDHIALEY